MNAVQRQVDEDLELALAIEQSEVDEQLETERRILDRICESQAEASRLLRAASINLPRQTCLPACLPAKHVPPHSEAERDHERLLERLRFYGMEEMKVKGDGNCQFRALSEQLYRTEDFHTGIRERAVRWMEEHPGWYEPYVQCETSGRDPRDFADYLAKMGRDGEWGDHVTLQAVSDCYGVEIFVVSSYMQNGILEVKPRAGACFERALWLSFWAEVHYNSIYPAGEMPQGRQPKAPGLINSLRKMTDDVFFGRL